MAIGDNAIVDAQEPSTPAPGVGQFQPNTNIFTDPRFLAFGRQQQFQTGQGISQAREQQRLAQIELQSLIPRLREQGVEQREDIRGVMESRGLFRSGERLRDEQRSRRGEERAVSGAQTQTAQTLANLEQQIAALRANAAAGAIDQALLTEGGLRSQVAPGFQQAIQQRELELLEQLSGIFTNLPQILQQAQVQQGTGQMFLQPNRFNRINNTRVQTTGDGRVVGL